MWGKYFNEAMVITNRKLKSIISTLSSSYRGLGSSFQDGGGVSEGRGASGKSVYLVIGLEAENTSYYAVNNCAQTISAIV